MVWRMMLTLTLREGEFVAMSLSKLGMRPTLKKEHEPERGRDLDRPEPERPAPAREQHTPKRHGLGL